MEEAFRVLKTIRLLEDGVSWAYRLERKRPFPGCEQVIPLLVHDGRQALRIREESGQSLLLRFGDTAWRLECSAALRMRMRLERSLLSVSGVSAQLRIVLAEPGAETPAELSWQTTLRRISG
ncbi:hypothetical protein N6H14_15340 [Paenibacillus sp. CC-CFT747]|nr:hypothetical protein N6H14_15340 [Paenibacillus sp. CC-CFT747]